MNDCLIVAFTVEKVLDKSSVRALFGDIFSDVMINVETAVAQALRTNGMANGAFRISVQIRETTKEDMERARQIVMAFNDMAEGEE